MLFRAAVIVAILSMNTLANNAQADTIKQREYRFSYDCADGMLDATYLVCDDCASDRPTMMPFLVARSSIQETVVQPSAPPPPTKPAIDEPIETIHFKFGSSKLLTSEIARLAKLSPREGLLLDGYTCTIGPSGYNKKLSGKRADSVAKYLRNHGFSILGSIGRGESRTYADRQLNRRVEIFKSGKGKESL